MIALRRLLGWWPVGTVPLDRPRLATFGRVVLYLAYAAVFGGMLVAEPPSDARLLVPTVAALATVAVVVYRFDLGPYAIADSDGMSGRLRLPGSTFHHRWDEISWIGWATTDIGEGGEGRVLVAKLSTGERLRLPNTITSPRTERHQHQVLADIAGWVATRRHGDDTGVS